MYGSSFCIVTRRPRALQQPPERRGREALAQTRRHSTGHEDVLRHVGRTVAVVVPELADRGTGVAKTFTAEPSTSERSRDQTGSGRATRTDASAGDAISSWLSLAAVVLRLPAVLSSRHLSFDDGVYGATAVAMRHGARPYRDVFSSQGPLHLPLLYVADLRRLPHARTRRGCSRSWPAVAITIAVYLIARRVAGTARGRIAAALLATTSGSLFLVTTGISGDGPAIAFAAAAVAVAFAYRERPSTARAVWTGLLVGAACSVKLLAAPVVVPVGARVCSHAGGRATVVTAAIVAVAVPLVLAAPWGYSRVWDQSVRVPPRSAPLLRRRGACGA